MVVNWRLVRRTMPTVGGAAVLGTARIRPCATKIAVILATLTTLLGAGARADLIASMTAAEEQRGSSQDDTDSNRRLLERFDDTDANPGKSRQLELGAEDRSNLIAVRFVKLSCRTLCAWPKRPYLGKLWGGGLLKQDGKLKFRQRAART